MEKEEALQVLTVQLQEMNKLNGKEVSQRFAEMRAVVNLLAIIVLAENKIIKSCVCLPVDRSWYDTIKKYCRKCEATIIE